MSSIDPYSKIIGISYEAIVLKDQKKKQKSTTHITFYENAYYPTNKTYLRDNISKHFFKIQGIVLDLSMMRVSYKLRKEQQKLKKLKNRYTPN